jgi:hypothetical protein
MHKVNYIAVILFVIAGGAYSWCIDRLATQNTWAVVKAPAFTRLVVVFQKACEAKRVTAFFMGGYVLVVGEATLSAAIERVDFIELGV